MLGTSTIPHERLNLDPRRPLPDPYLGLSAAELADERTRLQMLVLDSDDPRDQRYWQSQLDALDRRIRRYRERGVRWPDRRRADDLLTLARDLKAAVDLASFLNDTMPWTCLERSGAGWRGHCVAADHEDRHPSMSVAGDRWRCWGCGRRGDVYDAIALAHGLPEFQDQVAALAAYVGEDQP